MKQCIFFLLLVLILGACTPSPGTETLTVFFLDENNFAVGTEPYEKAVTRTVPVEGSNRWEAVLNQLFLGPTEEEQAQGLRVVLSGTTGYRDLKLQNGVVHITLTGECSSGGSTYTIANLIFANLKQFPLIKYVKIHDQNGETETPEGLSDSIPFCLEP